MELKQCMCPCPPLCFYILDQIYYGIYEKRTLIEFSIVGGIYMYPYHTEPTAIIGIKPIAIHTS